MTSRGRISHLVVISFIIILGIAVPFTGCSYNSVYKRATAIKNGVHFSFEYPVSYTLVQGSFLSTDNDRDVIMLHNIQNKEISVADKEITILSWEPSLSLPNAKAWLEDNIESVKKMGSQFELIERSLVRVDSIDGEMIAYSNMFQGTMLNSTYLTVWEVYLDYGGLIWEISVSSVMELADQAKSDFTHLINSFKFLG